MGSEGGWWEGAWGMRSVTLRGTTLQSGVGQATHTCSQDGPAVALWFPWKFISDPLAQDKELTSPDTKVEQGR